MSSSPPSLRWTGGLWVAVSTAGHTFCNVFQTFPSFVIKNKSVFRNRNFLTAMFVIWRQNEGKKTHFLNTNAAEILLFFSSRDKELHKSLHTLLSPSGETGLYSSLTLKIQQKTGFKQLIRWDEAAEEHCCLLSSTLINDSSALGSFSPIMQHIPLWTNMLVLKTTLLQMLGLFSSRWWFLRSTPKPLCPEIIIIITSI